MKDDLLYVAHILECISRIERYCAGGEAAFLADELVQDGVLRNLQILAESSQRLSADLKSCYASVDWRGLSGLRNVLAHDYLGLSVSRIWQIVSKDLPMLKRCVTAVRDELTKNAS